MEKEDENKKYKQVQNYIIGRTLGEGTFGKVKIGIHLITQQPVAIKILEKAKIQDQGDLKRVTRELLILKKLKHRNLIQLYEIMETSSNLYLIMEFAENGELFQHIVKNKRLNEQESCRIYFQLIDGIDSMHQLGIVHRDLKPENLLMDSQMNIKIADFGLGSIYKQGDQLKTACGSPCYAAPEMIEGKKYNGLQVDIWSSGVVLFAMMCGYLPFDHPDTATLYKKILSGVFSIPRYISENAQNFIKRVLETDPNKRITISEMKKHPFYSSNLEHIQVDNQDSSKSVQIDQCLVQDINKYGFDAKKTYSSLLNNEKNQMTATYYLLKKQQDAQKGRRNNSIQPNKQQKPDNTSKHRNHSVNNNDRSGSVQTQTQKNEFLEQLQKKYEQHKNEEEKNQVEAKINVCSNNEYKTNQNQYEQQNKTRDSINNKVRESINDKIRESVNNKVRESVNSRNGYDKKRGGTNDRRRSSIEENKNNKRSNVEGKIISNARNTNRERGRNEKQG